LIVWRKTTSDVFRVLLFHVLGLESQTLEVDRAARIVARPSLSLGMLFSSVAVQALDLLVGFGALGAFESIELGRRHLG
jgi:hypothetical protein